MVKAPFTWRMLLRRGWLLGLACVAGIGIGSALSRVSVSATSAFHVSVRGAHQTPYQASRLALSYARLLPEAPSLLARVGRATSRSERDVRQRLTMSVQPATSIVYARFSAENASAAVAGMSAVTAALRSADDGAGSNLRATVAPLADPSTTSGFSRTRALALGAVGGLLVALALMLALERRWPRVDDLRDLAGIVPLPVSRVGERSLPAALARLAHQRAPGSVELVTIASGRRGGVLRRRLLAGAPGVAASARPRAPGAPPGAARALVVGRGTPAASVEEAWRESAATGPPLVGALLVDRTPILRRLRGGRHGVRAA